MDGENERNLKHNDEKARQQAVPATHGEKADFASEMAPFIIGVLLALAVLFIVRWGFLCPGYEYEPDCFYHARIVEDGPSVFMAKTFPRLISSTWAEHFSDKELGFHLILWALTRVGKLLGATNQYPFHYQVMSFDLLLLAAFAILLYRCKVKYPWLFMVLLVTAFPPMTFRLISLRAYLLSMTISVVLLIMFMDSRFSTWKWRYLALAAVGFVASWSYSSPHLLLTTIVPFAIADFAFQRRWSSLIATPAAFVLGMVLGLTIHPQFPNTYYMFKVQCIDVVWAFFLNMEKIPLGGGQEFYTSTLEVMRTHYFSYLGLPLISIVLLYKYRNVFFAEGWLKNTVFNGLMLASLLNTILAYKIFRFNEYALVPQCIFLAVIVAKVLKSKKEQKEEASVKRKPSPAYVVLLVYMLACLGGLFWYISGLVSQGMGELPALGVAEWADQNKIPEDTVIANAMWSDFPKLYYALPKYRFNWGLDPAFTWHHSPEVIKLLSESAEGRQFTPKEFAEVYKARYLYVHILQWYFAEYCWKQGLVPIYQNWDGYIFDLSLPPRTITSSTPELLFLDIARQGKGSAYVMQFCIEKLCDIYGVPIEKK